MYPWKNSDIQELNDNIVAAIQAGAGGTPVARVFTSVAAVASGSVSSGANAVQFITSEDFVGTINGVSAVASFVYPWINANLNNTLPAIAYTVTAGTITINVLT